MSSPKGTIVILAGDDTEDTRRHREAYRRQGFDVVVVNPPKDEAKLARLVDYLDGIGGEVLGVL